MRQLLPFALSLAIFVSVFFLTGAFFPSGAIPDYCSKDIEDKQIEPLSSDESAVVAKLIQVQAIFRHGARIPWKRHKCWKNYNIEWNNCDVFQLGLPQLRSASAIEENVYFRKVFDASPNQFGGNCLTGQLLEEGYHQEKTLGDHLRLAYIDCKRDYSSCFPLFETNKWSSVYDKVYFRADDEARVMMSGQLVMSNLFDFSSSQEDISCDGNIKSCGNSEEKKNKIIIDIHTGEYALDRLYPNYNACPSLKDLEDSAYSSEEFIQTKVSDRVKSMESQLNSILGGSESIEWSWETYLDCVMTAVCTNRSIPIGIGDHQMSDELFISSLEHSVWRRTFLEKFNSSAFSKLSMGLLFWEIRHRIQNAIAEYSTGVSSNNLNDGKTTNMIKEPFHPLYLYAAHDSSLMPILAALLGDSWDSKWASYGAMISFEIYQVQEFYAESWGQFAFRIIYNGKPLILPGCDVYLCDVRKFFDATQFSENSKSCA